MPQSTDIVKLARRMNPRVSVRSATAADATAFENLMNSQYSRKKPAGYYAWRFEKCPEPSILMIASEDEEIIGCMGGHVRALSDGRRVLFSVDLIVTPTARNRGISILLEESLESFSRDHKAIALVAMPNANGLRSHLAFPGCRTVGFIPTLVQRKHASDTPVPLNFDSHGDQLIYFPHSSNYAAWRYDTNPEYTYERLAFDVGCSLVYKHFVDQETGATFVDILELHARDPMGTRELLTELRRRPSVGADAAITLWSLHHTPCFQTLDVLGFHPEGSARAFCVRSFDSTPNQDLQFFHMWTVSETDSEVY